MNSRINPITPRLRWDVLSPHELEQIHEATLEIFEQVGIRFPSEKALDVLEDNGCQVDWCHARSSGCRARSSWRRSPRRPRSTCWLAAIRTATCSSTASTAT